jgi:hypothetical protein
MPGEIGTDVGAALLDDLLSATIRALDASTGGVAICTFTKAGIAVPAMKYAEGRWAALREVRRASIANGSVQLATVAARSAWRAAIDKAGVDGAGPDWIAYRSGGIDALVELTASLASAPREELQ